jgi:hypothetical protein
VLDQGQGWQRQHVFPSVMCAGWQRASMDRLEPIKSSVQPRRVRRFPQCVCLDQV